MADSDKKPAAAAEDEDYDLIFRPWFIHPKTGKRVYPKNGKVFPIRVPRNRDR